MTTLHNLETSGSPCVLDVGGRPEIKHKSFVFYYGDFESRTQKRLR
jgi:hypothetical protein